MFLKNVDCRSSQEAATPRLWNFTLNSEMTISIDGTTCKYKGLILPVQNLVWISLNHTTRIILWTRPNFTTSLNTSWIYDAS